MSVEAPSQIQPVFDPENIGASLRAIRGALPLRAHTLDGFMAGDVASRRKGDGYEINGVRDYVPGDDPRYIDWLATARQPSGWPQLREHHKDINPTTWIITDVLQDRYRSNGGYHSERNLGLAAVFGVMRLAHAQGMPTAVIAANEERIIAQKQPLQGRPHVQKTAHQLVQALTAPLSRESLLSLDTESVAGRPRLNDLLRFAGRRCNSGLVIVVSDFRDAAPKDARHGWAGPLKSLARQNNDIISIELTNPWDYELPAGRSRFVTEQGVAYVPRGRNGQAARQRYQTAVAAQQATIKQALDEAGAYRLSLSTDDPRWASSFRAQLTRRG